MNDFDQSHHYTRGFHHTLYALFLRYTAALCFVWGLLATAAPACAGGYAPDVARGKVVAMVRCGPCHYLDKKLKKVGPGLQGIFNRNPSISGVPFIRWDAVSLDLWLKGPRRVKPNTRMWMPPLPDRDRRDIVAWLSVRDQR